MSALPAPEQLVFLQEALAAAAALDAADRLGVLARLEAGPADPAAIARDCAIGERGARRLLAALAALGPVEAVGDGSYRSASPAPTRLAEHVALWRGLAAALSDDRPKATCDTPSGAAAFYPEVVLYLGALCAAAAEHAADHLSGHLSDHGLRVLDVGAGAAPWSLALARRDRECRVTALDLPAVLPATRRAVATAGMVAQVDYLGGDLFALDLGREAYDLAIAGNICHLFGEATNRRLLKRLFVALRPGGQLAILDELPNEQLDGPRPVVLHALSLLLRTLSGGLYPLSAYVGWLREAGFEAVERLDLPGALPLSLVTARRP